LALEPDKPKKEKGETKKISFDLFKQGKTVSEIASDRGFTQTTIEGHLAYFIEQGEIDVLQLVDEDILNEIKSFLNSHSQAKVADIKLALPEHISYGQIQMVLAANKQKK
jgi:uncharacterized protein YpbB